MKHLLLTVALMAFACAVRLQAQGANSISLWGTSNTHNGAYSAVGGSGSSTSSGGQYGIAFGNTAVVNDLYGVAMGANVTVVSGAVCSLVVGNQNTAWGPYSTALGYQCQTGSWGGFAQGQQCIAYGICSGAIGALSSAYSSECFAIGHSAQAGDPTGVTTIANRTNYTDAFAFGNGAKALNWYAYAMGANASATGASSVAIGQNASATAFNSIAIGPYPVTWGSPTAWNANEPLVTISNGTDATTHASNALVVLKSGAVLINQAGDLSMGSYTAGTKPNGP
jgi:hypothetical protein